MSPHISFTPTPLVLSVDSLPNTFRAKKSYLTFERVTISGKGFPPVSGPDAEGPKVINPSALRVLASDSTTRQPSHEANTKPQWSLTRPRKPIVIYQDPQKYPGPTVVLYNSRKENGYLWCPVFKQYLHPTLMETVHIIPEKMDKSAVGYLFGEADDGEDHISSPGNTIIMSKCIARAFNQGDFAIIHEPGDQTSDEPQDRFKLVLIKQYLADQKFENLNLKYSEFNGIYLEFKSNFRPTLKYLYFRYLAAMLLWLNFHEARTFNAVWVPRTKWLRETLMVEFARRIENWAVYEEVCMGRGMFDDDDESGLARFDSDGVLLDTNKLAQHISSGLLSLGYTI